MRLSFHLLLACIFLSGGLAAQLSPSNLDEDWEHWSETVKISLGVRKGFMSSVSSAPVNLNTFFVWKPDREIEEICVLVRTNDGLYNANMRFNVAGEARGFVELAWPTAYKKELRGYKRDEISMIGAIGDNCDVGGQVTACSFVPEEVVEHLTFFVKTSGLTEFSILDPETGSKKSFTCSRLEGLAASKGVNCRCEVPLRHFSNGRRYFIQEFPEGEELGTNNTYELKIRL
ncbi:hypothetical protein [Neolewinella persica]|uniref:hypothetical protein n=1 Tax=Neolewinella persica TaxID=70998 RepID=UPI00039C2433|nr:hypothetical protein [Neolewinella persica]